MSSNVMLTKSVEVTLADLKKLPKPTAIGKFHKPIPPHQVIDTMSKRIKETGHDVKNRRIAINPKQTRVMATFDIAPPEKDPEKDWSVGIMTSTDRTSALKMAGGSRIIVCDNLMVIGDLIQAKRKHTSGIDLEGEVDRMLEEVFQVCQKADAQQELEEGVEIDDDSFLSIVGDALISKLLPANHVRDAAHLWLKAELEDVKSRTLWGVHNAFTRQIQKLNPIRQFPASLKIGQFCDTYVPEQEEVTV